jgi:rhamnopyranosyl-N-acetylglucosaminyl-diphospho-decaprenol beta-1,3/1,4-galactofuranosyltransferase
MSNKNVLAVVVTHNRLELLKRCINYLQQQTVPADILIIDNASSDGTKEYLTENNIDHITQENSGSAGGWWRALNTAAEREYRYAWLMDDDGFPDIKALEVLSGLVNENTICLSSTVVKENKTSELVFGMPRLNRNGFPVILSSKRKFNTVAELPLTEGKYPHAHLFNGALINVDKVKQLGEVDRSYFMYGDEVDYFYRMRNAGNIYSAVNALHYHPDVSQRNIDKKKVYYFIRNTIILNHLYFDKAYIRDFFTVGVAMFRILKRNGLKEFFSYFFGSNRKYFYPAISDGYKKRKTNRYT